MPLLGFSEFVMCFSNAWSRYRLFSLELAGTHSLLLDHGRTRQRVFIHSSKFSSLPEPASPTFIPWHCVFFTLWAIFGTTFNWHDVCSTPDMSTNNLVVFGVVVITHSVIEKNKNKNKMAAEAESLSDSQSEVSNASVACAQTKLNSG